MGKKNLVDWCKKRGNRRKVIVPLLIVVSVVVAGRLFDLHALLETLQDWVWQAGPWGAILFGTLYVIALLCMLPALPFMVAAAWIFGSLWGYITMLAATSLAAMVGFLIARYLAHDYIEKKIGDLKLFAEMKSLLERNSWIAIPFLRLMPILPSSFNNYALGLTDVSFWRYLIASELVFIPMTAVYVLGASTFYQILIRGEFSWQLILGTLGAALGVLLLGVFVKKFFSSPIDASGQGLGVAKKSGRLSKAAE